MQVVRRHSRSSDAFRYAPAMTTVSGNYVAARRMGVVDGVDFGLTGMVRPQQGVAGMTCGQCCACSTCGQDRSGRGSSLMGVHMAK